jgi:hypothetical protein
MKVELKYVLEDGETYEGLAHKCSTLGMCPIVYALVAYPIPIPNLTCHFPVGCTDITPEHWKNLIEGMQDD